MRLIIKPNAVVIEILSLTFHPGGAAVYSSTANSRVSIAIPARSSSKQFPPERSSDIWLKRRGRNDKIVFVEVGVRLHKMISSHSVTYLL